VITTFIVFKNESPKLKAGFSCVFCGVNMLHSAKQQNSVILGQLTLLLVLLLSSDSRLCLDCFLGVSDSGAVQCTLSGASTIITISPWLGQPLETDYGLEGRVLISGRGGAPQLVVHAASCQMHTRIISQGLDQLECETEHSFPCSVEVKNTRNFTSFPLNSWCDRNISFLSLSARMTAYKL
jgi:hypothetical protein